VFPTSLSKVIRKWPSCLIKNIEVDSFFVHHIPIDAGILEATIIDVRVTNMPIELQ
jgi:hypothetical protein